MEIIFGLTIGIVVVGIIFLSVYLNDQRAKAKARHALTTQDCVEASRSECALRAAMKKDFQVNKINHLPDGSVEIVFDPSTQKSKITCLQVLGWAAWIIIAILMAQLR